MLRFARRIHTTRPSLQNVLEQGSSVQAAKQSIEDYLHYFKTSKKLRPFVYRKRNASELLSRDLWDENAKSRIVPLEPPKVPSASALERVFATITTPDELNDYKWKLIELGNKPKYTKPSHIVAFLKKSAELNRFSHALSFLYTQRVLRDKSTTDILNLIVFFLYINPAKGAHNALRKVHIARRKLWGKADAVTDLLEASICLKKQTPIPDTLTLSISRAEPSKTIPKPLDLSKNPGASQALLNEYQNQYLTLKPVEVELKSHELQKVENVSNAIKFVESYDQLQAKLGKQSLFELVTESNTFGKYPEPEVEEVEEEVKEETK